MPKIVLTTPRLALRELSMGDLDFAATMLGDPDVMRFWPSPKSRREAEEWIRRQHERYARDGHGYWLAVSRQPEEPIGQAGLIMTEIDGVSEPALGYIMHRPFWRNGFAAEAGAACLEYAFETCGYRRVLCLVRPENIASLRVALKLGMKPERHTTYAGFGHLVFSASQSDEG